MKEIKLTKGKVTVVDDYDFEWLNQWKWYARENGNTFYAQRRKGNGTEKMHRLILGLVTKDQIADHKDGNGLNNQRTNLRAVTLSQNASNRRSKLNGTSKYLGVNWHKKEKRWNASIRKNGKLVCLGGFSKEEDAALAYNTGALKLHGEFANLNKVI